MLILVGNTFSNDDSHGIMLLDNCSYRIIGNTFAMGGKPSKGTPKDGRLKRNQPKPPVKAPVKKPAK